MAYSPLSYHRLGTTYPRTGLRREYRKLDQPFPYAALTTTGGTHVYNEIASGGAVGGSTARNFIYDIASGSGGAVCAGVSTPLVIYRPLASGGVVGGGSTRNFIYDLQAGLGGAVCSGSAPVSRTLFYISSGGAVFAGNSINNVISAGYAASGGATIGGSVINSIYDIQAGSGGAVSGGTATTSFFDFVTSSGGVVCAGASPHGRMLVNVTNGGPVCSGTVRNFIYDIAFGSGGAGCGGSAFVVNVYPNTASGGAILNRTAQLFSNVVFHPTTTGGLIGNGLARLYLFQHLTLDGGGVCGGAAIDTFGPPHITGNGGAVVGGLSGIYSLATQYVEGGVVCGSTATINTLLNLRPSGGTSIGGGAVFGRFYVQSSGGTVLVGGIGNESFINRHIVRLVIADHFDVPGDQAADNLMSRFERAKARVEEEPLPGSASDSRSSVPIQREALTALERKRRQLRTARPTTSSSGVVRVVVKK
jgi:hypothetical protein